MPAFICVACGTEFPDSPARPKSCPICEEERQFVPPSGQRWTTLAELACRHANTFRQHEPNVLSITTAPSFAIGQRALLIRTPAGNVLWDCITLLDDATRTLIEALGGLEAIAISHPHYYTTMKRWSEAFAAPLHLHAADREWVLNLDEERAFWSGESRELLPGLTLIRCGGHFAGGTVLHWADGAGGRGAIFSGDILQVMPDRKHLSFMRSYPNMMPLSAAVVERIAARLAGCRFVRIYGAFADREIMEDGEAALRRSVKRYVDGVSGRGPADREA
jgi:glyoxylase-like metal-dependent hydrolase (beta-lactamase superfamily II)